MKKISAPVAMKMLGLLAACLVISLLAGCTTAYTAQLSYQSKKASNAVGKSVSIGEIKNLREAKKGGKSDTALGTLRGGYGNPFPLTTTKKVPYTESFRELLSDAAQQAGYAVVESGAPRLDMEVRVFWLDGLVGYKMNIAAELKLLSADGGSVLASKTIEYGDGFALAWSIKEVSGWYKKFLTRLVDEVADTLKEPAFANAL